MTLTVIIVTLNRPDCMERCLDRLRAQVPPVDQCIVVDGSPDDQTRKLCAQFPGLIYLRNELGYGHMTHSRNVGLERATGDIVAFIDDDAFPHDGWSAALLEPYADAGIGGVGGRARNNQPNEDVTGIDQIGKLLPHGRLTGNFAANPAKILPVDHLIGCNMSYRRSILQTLGGLREDYPGTEVREETDIALRVRSLGHRLVFTPFAVVDHLGAPQVKGRRFDTRYAYYAARNHLVLLIRNYGLFSPIAIRYYFWNVYAIVREFVTRLRDRRIVSAFARLAADVVGSCFGFFFALGILLRFGRSPIRHVAASTGRGAELGVQNTA